MDPEDQNSETNNKRLNVEDVNIEILPIIYEIIRSVEKDNHHDNTAKTRDSQDCSQKVLELQKRLDQARAEIRLLPGIEYSKEQQLNHLEALKTQLRLKQELLQKYHSMVLRFLIRILANNEQLVQRLSESYPMRRAAQFVVRVMYSSKDFIEERKLHEKLSPEQFRTLMSEVAANFQNKIKQAHENIKGKMK
ncbi:hypothetical protein NQ314_020114 [Rhamnusium bicolor]|uniref:Mediator of RNA polymerase II transcription subunit 9 n=1 Tax=Rhamnusium bicolor TaxID=1586634 RepID=A0AAV8WL30_9CUCU|nr:hypothetical protein NQ314_020114 [Rhamnusium bicolor]